MPEPQQQSSADNAVHVVGPDGKHYKFPAGTTRDKAVEYFKKKGVSTNAPKTSTKSTKQATPSAPAAGASSDKNPLTRSGKEFWTDPGGTARKVEVGAGLGAQEAFGIKPPVEGDPTSTTWRDVAHQMSSNMGQAWKQSEQDWAGLAKYTGVNLAPVDFIAKGIEATIGGVARGAKQVYSGIKNKDPEEISRGALGGGASVGMLGETPGAIENISSKIQALPKVPWGTVLSMGKMQSLMDDYVHAAGLDLKGTFDTAVKKVNSEIGRFTEALTKAIPADAIDATKIQADAVKAIDDVVKTPAKYPPEVQQIAQSIKNHPPGKWDFETAKQFRTNIYAAMERSSGPMRAALTKTYSDLTRAMEKAAKSVKGGDYAWNFYNELTKKFHENFGPHVQSILDADSGAKVSGKLLSDRTMSREVVRELGKYGLDTTKVTKFMQQAEKIVKAKKFYGNSLFRLAYGTKAGAAATLGGYAAGAGHMGAIAGGALAGLSSVYLKNLRMVLELDPSLIEKVLKDRELPVADPNEGLPTPRAATPGVPGTPTPAPGTPAAPAYPIVGGTSPPGAGPYAGAAPISAQKIQPLTAAQKLALRKQASASQQPASASGTPTGPGAQASTTGSPSAESSTSSSAPEKTAMELEREELLKKAGKQVAETAKAITNVEKEVAKTPEVKKIPEGEHGSEAERLRAKNRERKAKEREQSVRTEVKGAEDKIAAGGAGHAQLTEDLPTVELEKNLEGDSPEGKTLVSALRKMGKAQKWDDDVYRGHLLEAVKGYEKRIAKKRSSQ
jgi:hypothetical protein